jgi:hypothetical protein
VITKVVNGWRPGGLIAYLMGPGRSEEHRRPRVIASWDGLDTRWQPASIGSGEFDLQLGPLVATLRAPAMAAGLPDHDPTGKRGYVWHCSARVAPDDRLLTDTEWADIARDLLDGSGVAARADAGGPRWVAIRHAEDHIHIVAVLVRQDDFRRFWPYRDYPRLRETARELECRHGLTITAAADRTAARAPQRGEIEKARRQGREPARRELARAARDAAVVAHDAEAFATALRAAGYLVELRHGPSGDPLGYKVARRGDVSSAGVPIFYSGSKLAADLSMPQLLLRWAARDGAAVPATSAPLWVLHDATSVLQGAGRARPDGADTSDVAHATADVLAAVRRWPSRHGQDLGAAAESYDRAARPPRGAPVAASAAGARLRRLSRQLMAYRRIHPDDDLSAAVALATALSALVCEVAAWQEQHGRLHQAVAARSAASVVATWSRPSTAAARVPTPGVVALGPRRELFDHGHAPGRPRTRTWHG